MKENALLAYFGISLVASIIAYGSVRAKSSHMQRVLFLAVVIWFSMFAGLRDWTVGTDVLVYGIPSFQWAVGTSFPEFCTQSPFTQWGLFAKAFMWVSAHASQSIFWYLFSIELVIVFPAFVALWKLCKPCAHIGVFVFGLMFYPLSFNMMRQMMAMGFVLMAVYAAVGKRPLHFSAWLIVGMMFHSSMAVAALVYPLIRLAMREGFSGGLKVFAIISATSVALCLLITQMELIAGFGFYGNYLANSRLVSSGTLRPFVFTSALIAAFLVAVYLLRGYLRGVDQITVGLLSIVLVGLVLLLLTHVSVYLYRVSFIYLYCIVLFIPYMIMQVDGDKPRLLLAMLAGVLVFCWGYDYYAVQGAHEVVPYLLAAGI